MAEYLISVVEIICATQVKLKRMYMSHLCKCVNSIVTSIQHANAANAGNTSADKSQFSSKASVTPSCIICDLKPDTGEYSKLCVHKASFPPLLKHLLNCHSHLSNCIISFIFLLLCPEYESIMSCGCPPKLNLAP